MDFSKRLLTIVFVITAVLIVANLVFFFFTGTYPEQMFSDWMQYVFGSECLILGVIKIAKVGSDTIKDKDKVKKELEELKRMAQNEEGK